MKVFAVIAAHSSCLGLSVYSYLGNWLLVALSQELTSTILTLRTLLTSLGICINKDKSVLLSTQMIHFVGAWLSSIVA